MKVDVVLSKVGDDGELIPLREVANRLQSRPSRQTVRRWMLFGIRGRKLPAAKIGGGWFTTGGELRAFVESMVGASPCEK